MSSTRPDGAFDVPLVHNARLELTAFVIKQARIATKVMGFSWRPCADAPSTYADLRGSFARSQLDRSPLPVSDANVSHSLYLSREADFALRFWHDVNHVTHRKSFKTVDELDLGLWHVAVGKAEGLSELALDLLDADLIGQTLLYAAIKGYAINQLRFDLDVVRWGVADAILLEKDRQAVAA